MGISTGTALACAPVHASFYSMSPLCQCSESLATSDQLCWHRGNQDDTPRCVGQLAFATLQQAGPADRNHYSALRLVLLSCRHCGMLPWVLECVASSQC